MSERLRIVLCQQLGISALPVERRIASFLDQASPWGHQLTFELERMHRKLDVAGKVLAEYDEHSGNATTDRQISTYGYLGLVQAFVAAARHEAGDDEPSRARILKWVNSAFNGLDHAGEQDPAVLRQCYEQLQALLPKGLSA